MSCLRCGSSDFVELKRNLKALVQNMTSQTELTTMISCTSCPPLVVWTDSEEFPLLQVPVRTEQAALMTASARVGVGEDKVDESDQSEGEVGQSVSTVAPTLEIRACNGQCGRCGEACVAQWRRWTDERPASFMTRFHAESYKRGIGNHLGKKCARQVHGWLARAEHRMRTGTSTQWHSAT